MWSIPLIVCAAIAGAVTLLVVGIFITVTLERQRHQRLLRQHLGERCLPLYYPRHLSITESNYSNVFPPKSQPRREEREMQDHQQLSWEENRTCPDPRARGNIEIPATQSPNTSEPKRRRSLRNKLRHNSLSSPAYRRYKQSRLPGTATRSPLSAITESNPSSVHEAAVESKSMTATDAPVNRPVKAELSNAKGDSKILEAESERKTSIPEPQAVLFIPSRRSTSLSSALSEPPEGPLPPLPRLNVKKRSRGLEHKKHGDTKLQGTKRSLLSLDSSSPSSTNEKRIISNNSDTIAGLQNFKFDFRQDNRISASKLRVPPAKQTCDGFCRGKPGLTSTHTSFELNNSVSLSSGKELSQFRADSAVRFWTHARENPCGDVSFVGKCRSKGSSARHSAYEYSSMSNQMHSSPQVAYGGRIFKNSSFKSEAPRPASIASIRPLQWHQKPSLPVKCYSSADPIPSLDRSRRHTQLIHSQCQNSIISLVSEPSCTTALELQSSLPAASTLSKVEHESVTSTRPSERSSIPSNQQPKPSRLKIQKTQTFDIPRADSDIFKSSPPSKQSRSSLSKSVLREQPYSPTRSLLPRSNHNPTPVLLMPNGSPQLPSPPIMPSSLIPRKTLVKGPRKISPLNHLPSSGSPRSFQVKKIRNTYKSNYDDLQNSTTPFQSKAFVEELITPNIRSYKRLRSENSKISSLTKNVLTPNQAGPTFLSIASALDTMQTPSNLGMSPSIISMGASSIWEDVSVREDSPELEIPISGGLAKPTTFNLQWEPLDHNFPHPEDEENFTVQRPSNKNPKITALATPQGKGLGLNLINVIPGTPHSLYDGDGFLRER